MTNSWFCKQMKNLGDQAFRKEVNIKKYPVFSKEYLADDVSKSVKDIRSSLIKKKNELKQKGSEAWIPPVIPPV